MLSHDLLTEVHAEPLDFVGLSVPQLDEGHRIDQACKTERAISRR